MPLALTARIKLDPKGILADRWNHDMAHVLAQALRAAFTTKVEPEPPLGPRP